MSGNQPLWTQKFGQSIDMTYQFYNIDTLMDAIVEEWLKSGKEAPIELAVYDDYSGKKFRRFQRRSKEEEEAFQSAKSGAPVVKARGSLISDDGEILDDDEPYICEFCTKLRGTRYDGSICDSCTECESCMQFTEYECSGCTYSVYREGVPYSDLVSADKILTQRDVELIEDAMTKPRRRDEPDPYDDHYSILD